MYNIVISTPTQAHYLSVWYRGMTEVCRRIHTDVVPLLDVYAIHLRLYCEHLINARAFVQSAEFLTLEKAVKQTLDTKFDWTDNKAILDRATEFSNFVNFINDQFDVDFNHILYLDEADVARQQFLATLN